MKYGSYLIKANSNFQNFQCLFTVPCPPINLQNGQVSYDKRLENGGYPFNTRATFHCDHSYILAGPSSILCRAKWHLSFTACNLGKEIHCIKNIINNDNNNINKTLQPRKDKDGGKNE